VFGFALGAWRFGAFGLKVFWQLAISPPTDNMGVGGLDITCLFSTVSSPLIERGMSTAELLLCNNAVHRTQL